MILDAVFEVVRLACLAAFAYPWFVGWASLMERWAGPKIEGRPW